jgi:hypothetical protein
MTQDGDSSQWERDEEACEAQKNIRAVRERDDEIDRLRKQV